MARTSQKRAVSRYRDRLESKGLARFEVLGRRADRDLIRSLARRLAENDLEAAHIRGLMERTMASEPPARGGILAALRASPLVGVDLNIQRPVTPGRPVDL